MATNTENINNIFKKHDNDIVNTSTTSKRKFGLCSIHHDDGCRNSRQQKFRAENELHV